MSEILIDAEKVLQAQAALAERNKYVDEMNPALRSKFEAMTQKLEEQELQGIKFYHWLGAQVNEILHNEGNVYGVHAMRKISNAWVVGTSTLYKAKNFYAEYTEDELDLLCTCKTAAGTYIGWAHVIQLLGVPRQQRIGMQERIVEEGMSAKALSEVVKEAYGRRRSGGRKFAVPKTVQAGINQLRNVSAQWLRQNADVWSHQDNSYIQKLATTPPDDLTHDTVEELESLKSNQLAMAAACATNATEAGRMIEQVQNVLDERGALMTREIRENKFPTQVQTSDGGGFRAVGRGDTSGNAPLR